MDLRAHVLAPAGDGLPLPLPPLPSPTSTAASTPPPSLLQLAFGLLGAWAFDLVGPKATCTKSDCQNILLIFDHPDMPVTTRPLLSPLL